MTRWAQVSRCNSLPEKSSGFCRAFISPSVPASAETLPSYTETSPREALGSQTSSLFKDERTYTLTAAPKKRPATKLARIRARGTTSWAESNRAERSRGSVLKSKLWLAIAGPRDCRTAGIERRGRLQHLQYCRHSSNLCAHCNRRPVSRHVGTIRRIPRLL